MLSPRTTAKLVSTFAAAAARLSVGCGMLFGVLLVSLHLLEPEFDPTWRFISEYQLGSVGWMMHLAFLALGISLASAGVAIFSQARSVVGYIGLAILGIAAIGMLMAAIFRTDPMTTAPEAATFSGLMHVLGASLDYTPVASLLLSFALVHTPAWRPQCKWLFLTTGVMLIAMFAFIAMLPHDGQFGPGVLAGFFGRLLLLSYLGWLAVVGFSTIRLRKECLQQHRRHAVVRKSLVDVGIGLRQLL